MDEHLYDHFLAFVQEHFEAVTSPIFTTNASGLWDVFLSNIPQQYRQHYTCNTCRRFVENYGGLVFVDPGGAAKSAVWPNHVPPFFAPAVHAVLAVVQASGITGVFVSSLGEYGHHETGEWNHLAITPAQARVWHGRKTAGQRMAELRQDFGVLFSALNGYTAVTRDKALQLLRSGQLYRADKVVGSAEWFYETHKTFNKTTGAVKVNLVWRAVALAPEGFAHVKNTMLGSLMDDIQAGFDTPAIIRRFDASMHCYMISEAPPTVGQVVQAEKLVQDLGVEGALKRRYLSIEDVPADAVVWRDRSRALPPTATKAQLRVFADIETRQKTKRQPQASDLPPSVVTWEKFVSKILPTAQAVEALVDDPRRFAALVTASDPSAPNILRWGNTASWYYNGGKADADIRQRVIGAGGRYDNVKARCSLIWSGYTDLDLHWDFVPADSRFARQHVYFLEKRIGDVWLDVDANGGYSQTQTPVENIRSESMVPDGVHTFYGHNYCERGGGSTEYRAELEFDGAIYSTTGIAGRTGWKTELFKFTVSGGKLVKFSGDTPASSSSDWGIPVGQYAPVDLITISPNLWGDNPCIETGYHVFFLIAGCGDNSDGIGRGFFPEMLRGEFREVRKTLDAYASTRPVENVESPACGIGFSKDNAWNLRLRVTNPLGVQEYIVDRFD